MITTVNFYVKDKVKLPESYAATTPLRAAIAGLENAITAFGIDAEKVVLIIDPSKTSIDVSGTII